MSSFKRYIRQRTTFLEVLYNHDDQVIVRQLLKELIPNDIKFEIVRRFNQYAEQYNKKARQLYRDNDN